MLYYSCLLSALLTGQIGDNVAANVIAHPPSGGAVNASTRANSDQLVTEAMALPPGGSMTGQPFSLLAAISSLPDRPRQIAAVHAYWRLVQSIGDYHYLLERQQRLARLN